MKWFFYANVAFEKWDWRNSIEKGIGGSETSQVEVTKFLSRLGHDVTSYAPVPDDCPGEWEGVKWLDNSKADFNEPGIWVLYRCPEILDQFAGNRNDQVIHLVFQDYWYRSLTPDRVAKLDRAVVLCHAHRRFLEQKCPELRHLIWITRNAIKNDLIAQVEAEGIPARNPHRMMYASSPDRGLKTSLQIYRRVKEFIPDMEFVATYGFDNIDKMIEQGATQYARDKEECLRLVEETGARFLGRVPQHQLYREWLKTNVQIYVTAFFETGWISGLEAQALGAFPVFSPIHAQGENTKHGVAVPGDPNDPVTIARAAAEVVRLATDPNLDRLREDMMRDVRENWGWEQFVWKKPGENWVEAAEQDLAKKAARVSEPAPTFQLCDNLDEVDCRSRWLHLRPGDVFLDIGAADGSWSLAAAEQGADVYPFDPNPRTRIRAMAADFNEKNETNLSKGTIFPPVEVWITDRTAVNPVGHKGMALDTWALQVGLTKCDFIKIDIEAMELPALRGMVGVLMRWTPRMMIEVHEETVRGAKVPVSLVTGFLDGLELDYRYDPVRRGPEGKRYTHLYCWVPGHSEEMSGVVPGPSTGTT